MEESSPGPFGEQESLNVEQSDSMAHEERGSARGHYGAGTSTTTEQFTNRS